MKQGIFFQYKKKMAEKTGPSYKARKQHNIQLQ